MKCCWKYQIKNEKKTSRFQFLNQNLGEKIKELDQELDFCYDFFVL